MSKAKTLPGPALDHIDPDLRALARPISDLSLDPANARKHPERNLDAIKGSLVRFGQKKPLVARPVNGNLVVVAGNGTLTCAKALGWTHLAVSVKEMSDAEATAYGIADNKTAELAEWDDEVLAGLLGSLDEELQLVTGFDDAEIQALISDAEGGTDGVTDPDDVPEQPPAISQRGDLWILGKHRLLCGDSTNAVDVNRLLVGAKPHLMVTDPPYGVEYDADWRNHALRADGSASNGRAIGKVANDGKADWRDAYGLFPGDVVYVWHADRHASEVQASIEACGFIIRCQIIWAKQQFAIGRGDYHWKHEPCWYAVRKGATGHWAGDRSQTTLWEIDKPQKSETGHSTQKPVECMEWPIRNNSQAGDGVYEPFSGSGTTIIAAEKLGRRCYAIEIEPRYVDVAVQRWCNFTGKDAVRESDGAKWSELAPKNQVADKRQVK